MDENLLINDWYDHYDPTKVKILKIYHGERNVQIVKGVDIVECLKLWHHQTLQDQEKKEFVHCLLLDAIPEYQQFELDS